MKKIIGIIIFCLVLAVILYFVISCNFEYLKIKRTDMEYIEYNGYQITDSAVLDAAYAEIKKLNFNQARKWNPNTWKYDMPSDTVNIKIYLKDAQDPIILRYAASDNTVSYGGNLLQGRKFLKYAHGGKELYELLEEAVEDIKAAEQEQGEQEA